MRQRFYAVFWTIATLAVVLGLVLLAFRANFGVNQRSINPASFHPPPAEGLAEQAAETSTSAPGNLPDMEVKETEIVLSSPDGLMRLRLHSDAASASQGVIELPRAEVEFFFADEKKLFLVARNVRYEVRDERAVVEGDLSGEIPALRERFTARGLTWDRGSHILTLNQVMLVDPAFRTEAREVTLDLANDLLEITGGVDVQM